VRPSRAASYRTQLRADVAHLTRSLLGEIALSKGAELRPVVTSTSEHAMTQPLNLEDILEAARRLPRKAQVELV